MKDDLIHDLLDRNVLFSSLIQQLGAILARHFDHIQRSLPAQQQLSSIAIQLQ